MTWLSYILPVELTKVNSPINGELKVIESFGKRILYAEGDEQSGGTIIGMWAKAIERMQKCNNAIMQQCLVLGLGGGTVIKILKRYHQALVFTVIELDPVIINIAKKYFDMDKIDDLNIINTDALSWIKQTGKKYDLVIFDLYVGKTNPRESRKIEFLQHLKKILNKSGIILFNAHYQNDEREYEQLYKDCRQVFTAVDLTLAYPYSRILQLR